MKKLLSKLIFKHQLKKNPFPVKIIVGANGDRYPGWISTEKNYFDITNEDHWKKYFGYSRIVNNQQGEPEAMQVISRILAENVFEYLNDVEAMMALTLAYQYLAKDGRIRIAVPDMNHTNPKYLNIVGSTPGIKSKWDESKLRSYLRQAGFHTQLKEGFTTAGFFEIQTWYRIDGHVKSSFWYHPENMAMVDGIFWSALVVDGIKGSPIITKKHKPLIIK